MWKISQLYSDFLTALTQNVIRILFSIFNYSYVNYNLNDIESFFFL